MVDGSSSTEARRYSRAAQLSISATFCLNLRTSRLKDDDGRSASQFGFFRADLKLEETIAARGAASPVIAVRLSSATGGCLAFAKPPASSGVLVSKVSLALMKFASTKFTTKKRATDRWRAGQQRRRQLEAIEWPPIWQLAKESVDSGSRHSLTRNSLAVSLMVALALAETQKSSSNETAVGRYCVCCRLWTNSRGVSSPPACV